MRPKRPTTRALLSTLAFLALAGVVLTTPALALNPERVYEMVSPPYKGGYGAFGIEGVALNGESVAFYSPGVFNESPASVGNSFDHVRYIARRVAGKGWTTLPLTPPDALSSNLNGSADLSPTLETAMVNALFENLEHPILEDNRTEFLVHMTATADVSSAWLPVGGKVLEAESKEPIILKYFGGSGDFCHLIFTNGRQGVLTLSQSLLPAARGANEPLYELNGGCHGEPIALRVVNVDNEGGEGKVISPACIPDLGLSGHYSQNAAPSAKFAIAGGGSEVFFTTCIANDQFRHQLFVRLGGVRTLEVSKPIEECSSIPCKGASKRANADFVGANEAGTKVFFTASLAAGQPPLVPGDLDRSTNLYMAGIGCPEGNPECAASEKIVSSIEQVSHDPAVGGAAEVQGVVKLAPDGSRAYFVARGVLGEGANAQDVAPTKGAENLYVYERGVRYPTGHIAFVGDLESGSDTGGEVPGRLIGSDPEAQTAGVDGRYLVFSTYAQLVPGDTDTAKDVYRYDAETGQLDRVSGGESGYDANGNNSSFDATIASADYNGEVKNQYELDSRAISEDGSRIVFSSVEALSPSAINNLPNVYEWHKEAGEQEGHVSIVSSGSSETPDGHAVISPDGRNVFFTTSQGLVPQDTDGAPDVYDARIEGGFPQQPAPRQQCSSDACQGPLTNPAPLLVPGSVSQAPGGNFGPAPVPVATVKAKKKVKAKRKVKPKPKRKRGKRAKASGRSGAKASGRSGSPSAATALATHPIENTPTSDATPQKPRRTLTNRALTAPPFQEPFQITKFTIEPTERTTIIGSLTGIGVNQNHEFLNEPYAIPFTQAGGHPWGLTTRFSFPTKGFVSQFGEGGTLPVQDPKDIVTYLPPGLLGDPMAVPRCPITQVTSGGELCPADTQVGVYVYHANDGAEFLAPVVNVTPEAGQSAEFALENHVAVDTPLLTGHLVHTSQGYGFSVVANGIPQVGLYSFELTFWGVPGDPSHDPMRGLFCNTTSGGAPLTCLEGSGGHHFGYSPVLPFLTLSTDCAAGAETATLRADSWEEPGSVSVGGRYSEQYKEKTATMPAVTGCGKLAFNPLLGVEPDTLLADEPVGLGVSVNVPLSETPNSTATPQLRNTLLTLPEGMSVSPGVVDGIRACEATGPEGIDIEGPESEEVGLNGELQLASGHCPDASVVGTAEAITPFLPVPVKGHVYLARPGCGGVGQAACTEQDALDGNLYRLYLELGGEGELAQTGVHFKVPLETEANPATGQLTTRVLGTPQAPFSHLKIHLNGGPRAPIANPAACGPAVTTADFTPWSAPGGAMGAFVSGTPDATPSSFFDVEGCASPPPLSPGFLAGTVTPNAGQFSSFTMNLTREDREQYIKGIQVHTPPGLLGMLSSVPLCGEPQADLGSCPESSKIGTTRVATGAGSHPFEIEGNVYLTGPYGGDPFGLSIVVHVAAGPFNLGLKVVRARIAVNREDSTLTITTDETGPYAVPQIVFGVPVRLKRVTVNIDRPSFMFNPTNCSPQKITASISGAQEAVASVSSPFAVGACKSLAFKPRFAVSTSGHTSRAKGASLDAKLSYPAGSVGNEANIARVKVDLPKQLPSRLTTLQKACTAAQFEANPAGCPAASIVGVVKANTPLLPVGLSGPVYFVSHGGEAFPSLIVVLQGDGVRVDLTGSTFISRAGITSSTFKTVPDVPVNTFEIYLPEGKYSALAANGNLCTSKLAMPTAFVAQNGAEIHETTKIGVTGCAHTRPKAKKAKAKKRKKQSTNGNGRTGK